MHKQTHVLFNMEVFVSSGHKLKILHWQKSGFWICKHSRSATSTSVLLWHRQAPRCCFSGGPNKVTGWPITSHWNDYNIYCIRHKLCAAVYVHALRLLKTDQLFEPLKQNLWSQILQCEEVEKAVHEWLWKQEPDFDHNGIFKLMVQQDKCIKMLRDCVRKH